MNALNWRIFPLYRAIRKSTKWAISKYKHFKFFIKHIFFTLHFNCTEIFISRFQTPFSFGFRFFSFNFSAKKKWEGNKIKQNAIRFSTFFCLCDSTWPFQYYFQLLTSSVAFIFIRSISVLIIFLWIVSSSSDYFSRAHLSRCSRKSPVWFFCWLY